MAFAWLATPDRRAIAANDHAATPLDDPHSVVLHVVIGLKFDSDLDGLHVRIRNFELKAVEIGGVGRNIV
jgi:hypothetical protein